MVLHKLANKVARILDTKAKLEHDENNEIETLVALRVNYESVIFEIPIILHHRGKESVTYTHAIVNLRLVESERGLYYQTFLSNCHKFEEITNDDETVVGYTRSKDLGLRKEDWGVPTFVDLDLASLEAYAVQIIKECEMLCATASVTPCVLPYNYKDKTITSYFRLARKVYRDTKDTLLEQKLQLTYTLVEEIEDRELIGAVIVTPSQNNVVVDLYDYTVLAYKDPITNIMKHTVLSKNKKQIPEEVKALAERYSITYGRKASDETFAYNFLMDVLEAL